MMRYAAPHVPPFLRGSSATTRRLPAPFCWALAAVAGPCSLSYSSALAQNTAPPSHTPATRPSARPQAKPRQPHNGTSGSSGTTAGQGAAWGDQVTGADAGDPELSDYAKETNAALHSLTPGNASIDVSFPGGGARGLEGSAGARVILPSNMGLSIALLAGLDKEAKKNGFGGAVKIQRFLATSTRAFPYAWGGINAGKNGGEGNKSADDFEAGAGLGFGVEVFLLKEISTSAEIGIASRVMPGDAFRLATGTSQIALHYFFGE